MSKQINQNFNSMYYFSFWFSQIGFDLRKMDKA
jgi:hypothetical protein